MTVAKSVLCCCLVILGWASAEEVTIDVPQGPLKGLKTTTVYQGKPLYSFKGIPYAKPNVGADKFKVGNIHVLGGFLD